MILPKRFDIFPLTGGCSEGLDAFRVFFKQHFSPLIEGCSEGLDAFRVFFNSNNKPTSTSQPHKIGILLTHVPTLSVTEERTQILLW